MTSYLKYSTGILKTLFLFCFFLVTVLKPFNLTDSEILLDTLVFTVAGIIIVPIASFSQAAVFNTTLNAPKWNEHFFRKDRILNGYHFGASIFIVAGFGSMIGAVLKFKTLDYFGLHSFSAGLGILIGVYATVYAVKKK